MIGAIAGDIFRPAYKRSPIKTKNFARFHPRCHFTDDTVLSVAIAEAILHGRFDLESVRETGRRYPAAGYGGAFAPGSSATIPAPIGAGATGQPWA